MSLITLSGVNKTHVQISSGRKVHALRDIHLTIDPGEWIAIMGKSGSGKSTLIEILTLKEPVSSGSIYWKGKEISNRSERENITFRRKHLGTIFQGDELLETLTIYEQLSLPLVLLGKDGAEIPLILQSIGQTLEITQHFQQYPYELSHGQKNLIMFARALVTQPELLIADEPTSALDSLMIHRILQCFTHMHQKGQTVLFVTHRASLASHAHRVIFIDKGEIFHELYRGDASTETMYQKIKDTWQVLLARGGEENEDSSIF